MVALRERMQERYADWRADLPPNSGWPAFFADCAHLDFEAIPEDLQITDDALVWPGRRNAPHDDAPEGAHICRAFDWIEPEGVRVVVLGQDPYPRLDCATGRAFEDGTPDAADEALRPALRNLGLSALDLHGAACPPGFCHGLEGRAAAIRDRFDALAVQGVLCLNASWTYTREDHQKAHRRLWKPVTAYVLRRLVDRQGGCPVFLLLGDEAQTIFDRLGLHDVPEDAAVRKCHPTERKNWYFAGPNPLQQVNETLRHLRKNPITWWPPAEPRA